MNGRMLAIQAISPIHVGAGQGAGVIDLPVIREATTGWPYLPGSSIKGVLRDTCTYALEATADPAQQAALKQKIKTVFGPGTDADPAEHAGGLVVGDQHLLCLAVRSWFGTFAWVSCPFAINRWIRDARAIDQRTGLGRVPTIADNAILLPDQSNIANENDVYLEELKLTKNATPYNATPAAIAKATIDSSWDDDFKRHFGIVSDTTFGFWAKTAMDIVARNTIDETRKIVKKGHLWWEESVPAESIFVGPVIATPQGSRKMDQDQGDEQAGAALMFEFLQQTIDGKTLQIGGNATVGRGLALAHLAGGKK